jgi:hypothetical protein
MNLRFNSVVKQNRALLSPGFVYDITDAGFAAYAVAMGWAEETSDPVDFVIDGDELAVDAETYFADGPKRGQLVLGS